MKKDKFTNFVFAGYLILLIWLVLFKLATSVDMIPHFRGINLVPFGQSVILNGKIDLKEIIYNILAFIPLGVYLQFYMSKESIGKKIFVGFLVSFILEFLQYIFAIGGSDITDLITNITGVILGLGLYKLFSIKFREKAICIINFIGLSIEICACCLIILLSLAN